MPDRLGRPTAIDRTIGTRPDGTPITTADQIIDRIRLGTPRRLAAASAGINVATLFLWRAHAHTLRAALALNPTHHLYPYDHACLDFLDRLEQADGEVVVRSLGRIQQAAQGGATSTSRTTTVIRYEVVNGQQVEVGRDVTVVEDVAKPDWHADGWLLERLHHQHFARRTDVSIVAPDEVDPEQRAGLLADSLREVLGRAIEVGVEDVEDSTEIG